jgi:fused signal recognition particle receptor
LILLLKIITRIESRVDKYLGIEELNKILQEEISGLLSETNTGEATEFVIPKDKKKYVLMVGVNGVKTTIGKLAFNLKAGYKVVLGAEIPFAPLQ